MGLGPCGDGRTGPRRRAGPMTTAILFGFLLVGGWRLGPPSASAGPPRLRRRPAALRGDVCGDARVRAADGVRSRTAFVLQVSKAAGPRLCRSASPLPLGLRPSPRRGHCVMGKTTMKPRNMVPGALEEAAERADKLLETKFTDLTGDLRKTCSNKDLLEAVRQEMDWPYACGGEVLYYALVAYRERAKAPKPKRKPPVHSCEPAAAKRQASALVTACLRAAQAVSFDEATAETTIMSQNAVETGLRACNVRFNDKQLSLAADPAAVAVALLNRVVGWPDEVPPPGHLGEFFAKVAAMPEADRNSLVEQTKASEHKRLYGKVLPTHNAPPPRTRSAAAPSPEPVRLAAQDQEGEPAVATANAPKRFETFRLNLTRAVKVENGEKVAPCGQDGRPKSVDIRGVGDKKWRTFESRSDAARAYGITSSDISRLIAAKDPGYVGKRASAKARGKCEVRDVSQDVASSPQVAKVALLRDIGVRFQTKEVNSTASALALAQRAKLSAINLSTPQTWVGLLESLDKLDESQYLKLAAATGEAENERVNERKAAGREAGKEVLKVLRKEKAAADLLADEEALEDLLRLGFDLEGELEKAIEADVKVCFVPESLLDDGQPVYVEYKGKRVELKAGPWYHRVAIGDGNLCLGSAGGAGNPYGSWKTPIATITRPEPGDAAILTAAGARGDTGVLHRGDQGRFAATFSARVPAGTYIRKGHFCSIEQMKKLGFELVGETEAVTTANGATVDGFEKCRFAYRLTEGGPDLIADLQGEFLGFREALLGVTLKDKRLAEGVYASTRRHRRGTVDELPQCVSFQLNVPCRKSGPTPRTKRAHQYLKEKGYSLLAELHRRCIVNSVAFEFLAYRDPTKGGPFHVDQAKDLLIAQLQMTSVTMQEGANRKGYNFSLEECSVSERADEDSRGLLPTEI